MIRIWKTPSKDYSVEGLRYEARNGEFRGFFVGMVSRTLRQNSRELAELMARTNPLFDIEASP